MKEWALDQVVLMRESRKEINIDIKEHLAAFISTLHGRLIVTRRLGHANSNKEDSSMMLRSAPAGRLCTEEKKAFLTCKSVTDWCKENGVAPKSVKEELDKAGYLVYDGQGECQRKMYIGQGSTVPSGQTRCYEIKYHKLMDGLDLAAVPDTEVQDVVAS